MADMSEINRRDLMLGISALAAVGGLPVEAQNLLASGGGRLGKAQVFSLAGPMKKLPNGAERWQALEGTVPTGESVSVHESVTPAGTPAPALHRIQHSELTVVLEGTLEYEHDDVTERAEAGSILYIPSGTNHRVRNAGTGTARYFVVAIGGDTKKT
jgi:quercetin dioxygenase-like cupin family protein